VFVLLGKRLVCKADLVQHALNIGPGEGHFDGVKHLL
jgi:hypothetical protein